MSANPWKAALAAPHDFNPDDHFAPGVALDESKLGFAPYVGQAIPVRAVVWELRPAQRAAHTERVWLLLANIKHQVGLVDLADHGHVAVRRDQLPQGCGRGMVIHLTGVVHPYFDEGLGKLGLRQALTVACVGQCDPAEYAEIAAAKRRHAEGGR